MWSVWCRVCRLHQPTFTPLYWRTPLFSNRQALKNGHGLETTGDLTNNFSVLKKCNGKLGLSDFRNVIHNEKAMLEHTIRLHKRKNYLCKILSLSSCIFYVLSPRTVYIKLSNFSLFSVENDEMESSKTLCKTSFAYFLSLAVLLNLSNLPLFIYRICTFCYLYLIVKRTKSKNRMQWIPRETRSTEACSEGNTGNVGEVFSFSQVF